MVGIGIEFDPGLLAAQMDCRCLAAMISVGVEVWI